MNKTLYPNYIQTHNNNKSKFLLNQYKTNPANQLKPSKMSFNCKRIYISGFSLQQALYKQYFDTLYSYLLQHLPADWKMETLTENFSQVQSGELAKKVLEHPRNVGICLATSGVLESAVLNQTRGVRAAMVHTQYIAKMCRQHNDANICIIPTDCVGQKLAADLVLHYLKSQFDNEAKNKIRLGLVEELENKYLSKVEN